MSLVPDPAMQEFRAKAAGRHQPRLFVLSGPSGAGKDSVLQSLRTHRLDLDVVVTYTTRLRRADETDGFDYRFVTRKVFREMRARGDLLEDVEYAGNDYGVPGQPVRDALAQGRDVVLRIDVKGAALVKLQVPSAVLIFLTPPDVADLEQRIRERGVVNASNLQGRLARVAREFACIPGYDYLVINHLGRLAETIAQVEAIILAERARVNVPPVTI